MKTVAQQSDAAPRRLKFKQPDPTPTQARDKRAMKPEVFRDKPWKRERLPDGARFEVEYSAAEVRWSGELAVGDIVVEASCGSVFTLLSVLDLKYRARLAEVP